MLRGMAKNKKTKTQLVICILLLYREHCDWYLTIYQMMSWTFCSSIIVSRLHSSPVFGIQNVRGLCFLLLTRYLWDKALHDLFCWFAWNFRFYQTVLNILLLLLIHYTLHYTIGHFPDIPHTFVSWLCTCCSLVWCISVLPSLILLVLQIPLLLGIFSSGPQAGLGACTLYACNTLYLHLS